MNWKTNLVNRLLFCFAFWHFFGNKVDGYHVLVVLSCGYLECMCVQVWSYECISASFKCILAHLPRETNVLIYDPFANTTQTTVDDMVMTWEKVNMSWYDMVWHGWWNGTAWYGFELALMWHDIDVVWYDIVLTWHTYGTSFDIVNVTFPYKGYLDQMGMWCFQTKTWCHWMWTWHHQMTMWHQQFFLKIFVWKQNHDHL
jgi:hypothetical protein